MIDFLLNVDPQRRPAAGSFGRSRR